MSIIEERGDYKKNPFFSGHEYSDFSPFYITISIVTIIFAVILILFIYFACCSKYQEYWLNKHTGNRWLVSLWTATPHKQPALDYTELEKGHIPQPVAPFRSSQEYLELHKRESEI